MRSKLLTLIEVAEILQISEDRVYQLAREGIIPVVHMGRQLRMDEEKLDEFIKSGGKAWPGGSRKEING
ncbi:DNA-binding protein [Alicyclobacillaceae bacterium I2511]|nr:DNA-binding protein [Alicyclobacillaceae bacterium I2511]